MVKKNKKWAKIVVSATAFPNQNDVTFLYLSDSQRSGVITLVTLDGLVLLLFQHQAC